MRQHLKTIEIEPATAAELSARAAARGVSVSAFLADLLGKAGDEGEALAELDRRWERARAGASVAQGEVVAWLDTWGTADFRAWSAR